MYAQGELCNPEVLPIKDVYHDIDDQELRNAWHEECHKLIGGRVMESCHQGLKISSSFMIYQSL